MAKPDPAPAAYFNAKIRAFAEVWKDTVPWREEPCPSGADFVFTPPGLPELELGAGPGWFIVACGSAMFEYSLPDFPTADWALAICDAVAAGRVSEQVKINWIFRKWVTTFQLATRGIDMTVTHSISEFAFDKASHTPTHFAPWPTRGTL